MTLFRPIILLPNRAVHRIIANKNIMLYGKHKRSQTKRSYSQYRSQNPQPDMDPGWLIGIVGLYYFILRVSGGSSDDGGFIS